MTTERTLEIVREMAEMEVGCPVSGKHMPGCPCHGTGRVGQFSMLRKLCQRCGGGGAKQWKACYCDRIPYDHNYLETCSCGGTGWVPAEPTLELAVKVLRTIQDWRIELWVGGAAVANNGGIIECTDGMIFDDCAAIWALVEKVALKETK